jgi:hypothetical protein
VVVGRRVHKASSIFCITVDRVSLVSIPVHGRFGPVYIKFDDCTLGFEAGLAQGSVLPQQGLTGK